MSGVEYKMERALYRSGLSCTCKFSQLPPLLALHAHALLALHTHAAVALGSLQSLDWNGGLEWWNALYARKWGRGYTLRMHTIPNAR